MTRPTLNLAVAGQKCKASEYNENFDLMMDYIEDNVVPDQAGQADKFLSTNGSTLSWQSSPKPEYIDTLRIGTPCFTLDGNLPSKCIWLDGAEVSKISYASLYNLYGDNYGTPEDDDNFVLPDFTNRTVWGAESGSVGYIEAGLPNITGTWKVDGTDCSSTGTGAFNGGRIQAKGAGNNHDTGQGSAVQGFTFNASLSSEIYKDDIDTVQPPAIKCRFYTRYA